MAGRMEINDGKYVYLWKKYRPVLVSLMVASAEGEQSYKLSNQCKNIFYSYDTNCKEIDEILISIIFNSNILEK